MKKQLISSVACFALLVLMFVGSSIAWFTDSAANVNTMVAGKISIEQTQAAENASVLLPSVVVNKQVTVTNTGNQPCYVRTLFAFEDSADGKVLEKIRRTCADGVSITIPGVTEGTERVQFQVIKKDALGKETTTVFTVGYYVHPNALPVKESVTSLVSIQLLEDAGNDWMEAVGEEYEMFILSQACQVTGLDDRQPAVALNEVFDNITGINGAKWFAYILNHDDHYTSGALEAAVTDNTCIITIAEPANP